MKNKEKNDLSTTTLLGRISTVLIIITVVLLAISTVLYIQSNTKALARYELSFNATRFMNGSAYLTSEVRAFAATGDIEHYDNYWNEVYVLQNRDKGVSALRELGITDEEEVLLSRMSKLSDDLIPLEAEAMDYVKAGDKQAAMDIVYGDYYNEGIATIRSLRDELRLALDERTSKEMNVLTITYQILNIVTWIIAISVIVIQLIQKRMLYRLVYLDQLTDTLNYYTYRQKMGNGIPIREKGYVIAVDLKDFSIINSVCGVEKGDEIIKTLADTLAASVSPSNGELAAHIIGDRFVMLMQCKNNAELVERLTAIHAKIVAISEREDIPYLMPTFGISEIANTSRPERSYGAASFANGYLRSSGENTFYYFFDSEMAKTVLENRQMEDNFMFALENHEFEVWYQPKFATDNDGFVGAEALVRWRNEEGELISPGVFIPLFERNGMIAQLDEYVFTEVCKKQGEWKKTGKNLVPVSVNISRATFLKKDIVDRYVKIVKKFGVSTDDIELELTESSMNKAGNTIEILAKFRKAGFRILVDDFGVGYSTLSTLIYSSFDGIKLDKTLIDNMTKPSGKRLVEMITGIAHEFNMSVTAEGVETAEQAELIKKYACNLIQGFFYSRPLPEKDFTELLK